MTATPTETTNRHEPPCKEYRVGGVRAAIWRNEVQQDDQTVLVYNSTITRTYKNQQGEWVETNSFRTQDLPKLILAAQKAFEFASLRERDPSAPVEQAPADDDQIPV